MAEQDSEDRWCQTDQEVRRNLPPGVKLVCTLRGHTDTIGRIAWSPDGRILASPSVDKTIRLWEAETGKHLLTLEGHRDGVTSVAFDSLGNILISGSRDHTVRLWDVKNGACLRALGSHQATVTSIALDSASRILVSGSDDSEVILWDFLTLLGDQAATARLLPTREGHRGPILSVAIDPADCILASGSADKTIKLWEADTGRLTRTLEGHRDWIGSVAFDNTGQTLASGSGDDTIKLWETHSGRLLRTLEGHTGSTKSVAFSPDGRLLASKGGSQDNTIRLWSLESEAAVATIPEFAHRMIGPGLAFSPQLPILATVGSDPGTPSQERDRVIHIWELDLAVLLAQPVAPTVIYTSAKVVLVGESNVGKSYMAHRIATGAAPAEGTIQSTHGMRFWPLQPEQLCASAKTPENQRRDVVLWDMGGQEEYRLIHQLFLHDTTVALVLLDPTRGTAAFKEVEAWNKYLDKQLAGRAAVKLLVGAKLDKSLSE